LRVGILPMASPVRFVCSLFLFISAKKTKFIYINQKKKKILCIGAAWSRERLLVHRWFAWGVCKSCHQKDGTTTSTRSKEWWCIGPCGSLATSHNYYLHSVEL
jgi:hypothetical protein